MLRMIGNEEFGGTLAEGLEFKKYMDWIKKKNLWGYIDGDRDRERNKKMCKFNEERKKESDGEKMN